MKFALFLFFATLSFAQTIPLAPTDTVRGVAGTATAVSYTIFGSTGGGGQPGVIAQGQLPSSVGTLYTAASAAQISLISLANATGSPVTGVIIYINGTAAANQFIPSLTIPANGTMLISGSGHYELHDNTGHLFVAGIPPTGSIMVSLAACPSAWTEVASLDGKTLIGTLAAHGDVGTTGGADNITPTGSNSTVSFTPAGSVANGTIAWPAGVPAFTGSAGTVPAQTFTGSSATTSSNSAGTPSGTNASGAFSEGAISYPANVPTNASGAFAEGAISWPAGVPTFSGNSVTSSAVSAGTPAGTNGASATSGNCAATNVAIGTGALSACKATAPNLTVTAQTFTGSALGTHTHTTTATGTNAWPAGVPTIAAGVFTQPTISWPANPPTIAAGTFTQPTFTGNALAGHTHTLTATGTNGTVSFTPAGSIAWPAGVPTATAGAFTGTPGTVPAETFTGNSFDNRSAFVKVIFCQKS